MCMFRVCSSSSKQVSSPTLFCIFFFLNDTATTEIYPLSLHELFRSHVGAPQGDLLPLASRQLHAAVEPPAQHLVVARSEEHTSELQSQSNLVCRLLLEKKKATHSSLDANQHGGTSSAGPGPPVAHAG